MSAEKERAYCFDRQAMVRACFSEEGATQLIEHAREDARQPLIADLKELRTKHKALQEQLRQVEALCSIPDAVQQGLPLFVGGPLPEPVAFVHVASIRKILGGEHGE